MIPKSINGQPIRTPYSDIDFRWQLARLLYKLKIKSAISL